MQIALVKDFLVDPFLDPETMLIVYEDGQVEIKNNSDSTSAAEEENS